MEPNQIKLVKWAVGIVVTFILIAVLNPIVLVGAGERGVITTWGAVSNTVFGEGMNFRTPFAQSVHIIDIKTQKEQVKASAASKDLQTVTAEVALNFHPLADSVNHLYQQVGEEFGSRIIDPAIQEAIKAATAKYTAEELITKRPLVRDDIKVILAERLQHAFIVVDDVSIINLEFSGSFNEAIEKKVTAEQNALASKNKLEQIKYEAEQSVVSAKAEAESIRLKSEAANNEKYVHLKEIEVQSEYAKRWDGKLPVNMYSGSPIPFINLTK